jgi:hypothetical protein
LVHSVNTNVFINGKRRYVFLTWKQQTCDLRICLPN